ncbi:type II toxin-antitoxin system RelE/ParE family toxin [Azospirillum sp. CT11-132]|uniref:type II toxin-antitoxin system RelE/ParE family toxin n=1 Tax=Azospirillum sp. CT11-132 TaxID=3396317 RepID=UPI0039A49D5F
MPEIREYLYEDGRSPFAIWFDTLEPRAAAKVATAYAKIERGDVGKLEPVGAGVLEFKISYGPGYRVYLAYDGTKLVILLGGGDKTSQDGDIKDAKRLWAEYKRRKAGAAGKAAEEARRQAKKR